MILFFDICDFVKPPGEPFIGCENQDVRTTGSWSGDITSASYATRDAFLKAMYELILTIQNPSSETSGCTEYTTAWQTISGMSIDTRYTSFWDLAEQDRMDELTPEIYNEYTELINEVASSVSEILYYFSGKEVTTYWEYPKDWKRDYWGIECCSGYTPEDCDTPRDDDEYDDDCGDDCVDLNSKLTTSLSEVDSVEEFTNIIYSELIDVKNRQTISAYPTLKLLYERYNYNSLDFSNYQSSQYDYFDMDNFGLNVNNYWVGLIEQVVPATTIWESTYEYRNTVFDTQKYKYRHNNIYWGRDPSANFPFSAVSSDMTVSVILEQLPNPTDDIETPDNDVATPELITDGEVTNPPDVSDEDTGVPITTDPTLDNDLDARRMLIEARSKFESALENDTQLTKPLFNEMVGVWEMQHTCSPEFLGTVIVGRGGKEESSSGGAIIGGDTRPSVIP